MTLSKTEKLICSGLAMILLSKLSVFETDLPDLLVSVNLRFSSVLFNLPLHSWPRAPVLRLIILFTVNLDQLLLPAFLLIYLFIKFSIKMNDFNE